MRCNLQFYDQGFLLTENLNLVICFFFVFRRQASLTGIWRRKTFWSVGMKSVESSIGKRSTPVGRFLTLQSYVHTSSCFICRRERRPCLYPTWPRSVSTATAPCGRFRNGNCSSLHFSSDAAWPRSCVLVGKRS